MPDTIQKHVGAPLTRVDGRAKVTGAAKYSAEWEIPQIVHAVLVSSRIASGVIQKIDFADALALPGVLAVYTHENLPKPAASPDQAQAGGGGGGSNGGSKITGTRFMPMQSPEIRYAGQPVAVVVAQTLEQAEHAARLVSVSYKEEKPIAFRPDKPKGVVWDDGKTSVNGKTGSGQVPKGSTRGTPEEAFANAPIKVTAEYAHVTNHHVPIEPSATIAVWDGPDHITMYDAIQGVSNAQGVMAKYLNLPLGNVRIITKFVGAGFGCKGAIWPHSALCALAAKGVGKPVKLVLTRQQTFTGHGHRDAALQTIKLGAEKSGKLISIVHEKRGATSMSDSYLESNGKVLEMIYACPNLQTGYQILHTNINSPTFMRAPGEMPGVFAIECALDDLAYQVGIDPLQIRLINHADVDPSNGKPWSTKSLKECYARGAELFGWDKRPLKNRTTRDGNLLVGWGMATSTYPVHSNRGSARARLYADGHAVVQSAATDLGTGMYTVCTQVAADALGLPIAQVRFDLGDSTLPTTAISGGSMGAGSTTAGVDAACRQLRDKLIALAIADTASPLSGAAPDAVQVREGRLFVSTDPTKGETYSDLMKRHQMGDMEVTGEGRYGASDQHSMHSFGVHFCEIKVDEALGRARITRWVNVSAAGKVLNAKTARSQMLGAMAMGIGNALSESSEMDTRYGRYTNANLADYHIAVNADIPRNIVIDFIDENDPHVGGVGVKGMGELGIVGVSAAISNALFHATGKRLRDLPFTPEKLMG